MKQNGVKLQLNQNKFLNYVINSNMSLLKSVVLTEVHMITITAIDNGQSFRMINSIRKGMQLK